MLEPVLKRAKTSRIAKATAHHVTMWLGTRYPDVFPMVFVLGFPKSGTTWACQLIADYLRLPTPQFAILPHTFEAVVHGHQLPTPRHKPLVYVVRDGRDALVSLYFMLLRSARGGETRYRHLLPGIDESADDLRPHAASFLEKVMRDTPTSPAPWGEHCRAFFGARDGGARCGLLRYEGLLDDGPGELARCVRDLTGDEPETDRVRFAIDKYAFSRVSNRKPGEEDRSSHQRKGVAGDWKNHFTREAAEVFDRHAGDALVELGYEPDRSWVARCESASRGPRG